MHYSTEPSLTAHMWCAEVSGIHTSTQCIWALLLTNFKHSNIHAIKICRGCWTENQIHIDQVVWCVCVYREGAYMHTCGCGCGMTSSVTSTYQLEVHYLLMRQILRRMMNTVYGSLAPRLHFSVLQVTESSVGPGNEASVWFTTAPGDTISEKYTHSENQFINHSGMVVRHSSIPHNWDSIHNNSE